MARSLKIYQGEDQTPITDLTDMVEWPDCEFGQRAYMGEGTGSHVRFRDETGVTGSGASLPAGLTAISLAAHNVVIWTEGSNTMFRGRMGVKDYTRGEQTTGRAREVDFHLDDYNKDLQNIVVHGWARPIETDKARVQALVAAFLSGSPRTTTNLNGSNYVSGSNLVTLPANTYDRSTVHEVLTSIATTANKQFFVTIDSELWYDGNDSTTYNCPYLISELDQNETTIFAPIWDMGPASSEDGQSLLSGIWLFYGESQYVHVSDATIANLYSWWEDIVYDDEVTTAAEATVLANAILARRKTENRTYSVSIGPLSRAQWGSIKHGQLIQIKAHAIPDADDAYVIRRITELRWTSPEPETLFAHMTLDRPLGAHGTGPKADTIIPRPPPVCVSDTPGTVIRQWDFLQGNNKDTLQTLGSGLQYSGVGSAYNTASHRASGAMPVTAGSSYLATWRGSWFYPAANRDVDVEWYGNTGRINPSTKIIVGAGHPLHTDFAASVTMVAPVGATHAKIWHSPFMGIETNFQSFATAGTAADNDPNCIPASTDSGSSPHYARYDDPRFDLIGSGTDTVIDPGVPMLNSSGGDLTRGTVVVADTANSIAVTTTTSAAQTGRSVGVLLEDIVDGEIGLVAFNGLVEEVRVSGSPLVGDHLSTATVAGEAQSATARSAGTFGEVVAAEVTESPTLVAFGTKSSHATIDLTPGLPAGWEEDDIFLLFHVAQDAPLAPSGWTMLPGLPLQPTGSNQLYLGVSWRRATASESGPTASSGGGNGMAIIAAFRGCPTTGNPYNAVAADVDSVSNTTVDVPGATTTIANAYVLAVSTRGGDDSGARFSAWANADLSELTEIYDAGFEDGLGGGLGIAAGLKEDAGVYGTTTATAAVSTTEAHATIALEAASVADAKVVVLLWGQADPKASDIAFTPTGTIAATDVQAAIAEVAAEAGVGGSTWFQDVNESGASFANFTAGTGTWASDGTIIAQTDTAAAFQEAKFTAKVATGLPAIMEAEIRFPTTGAGVGATRIGGLTLGFDGADITTGFAVRLSESGDTIDVESANSANIRAIAFTIAKDIWYKLRVVRGSGFCDVYLDGALQGTVRTGSTAFDAVADFVGLYSFGTRVDYRNIKVWTLTGGLPA